MNCIAVAAVSYTIWFRTSTFHDQEENLANSVSSGRRTKSWQEKKLISGNRIDTIRIYYPFSRYLLRKCARIAKTIFARCRRLISEFIEPIYSSRALHLFAIQRGECNITLKYEISCVYKFNSSPCWNGRECTGGLLFKSWIVEVPQMYYEMMEFNVFVSFNLE